MLRPLFRTLSCLGASLLAASTAHASVIYEFSGTTDVGLSTSFTYTSANFVDTFTFVPFANLDDCSTQIIGNCFGVSFDPNPDVNGNLWITYFPSNVTNLGYIFPGGSFTTGGTFLSIGGNATLKVTDTAAVPEPATWAMMLVGFSLAGFAARRQKRVKASQAA